jgi:hypothetical protein
LITDKKQGGNLMIYPYRILMIMSVLGCLISNIIYSQEMNKKETNESNPLSSFERLIGGEWHLQGNYQTFAWGVGKLSVKSESYFIVGGEPHKVSEGVWFWHPMEKKIKGYFTAINMPVELFDYTAFFEGNTMISELKSYSSDGKEDKYLETWEFTDDNSFEWSLFSKSIDGEKKVMGGKYTRSENSSGSK